MPARPRWLKVRSYLHFDPKVNLDFAASYAADPARVARHSFYPFIRYEAVTRRYKRVKGTKKRQIEDKKRPICYASHLDSHIFAYYADDLTTKHETRLRGEPCAPAVLAYRRLGKCNIEFAHEAFREVAARAPCVALAFDIEKFFDRMDHALLKSAWCETLGVDRLPEDHHHVFRALTRYAWVDQEVVHSTFKITRGARRAGSTRICEPAQFREKVVAAGLVRVQKEPYGIPQGSPISAALSNIYMFEFDRRMTSLAQEIGGSYRRYCDDVLWIVPPEQRHRVEREVEAAISERRLAIQGAKTEICTFEEGPDGVLRADRPLQYLGFTFDGRAVSLRASTLARYYRRMKSAVRAAARAAKGNPDHPRVYRRALYERFSHLGAHNFLTYGRRAAKETESEVVRRQVGRHWSKLTAEIKKRDEP